jgi:hypothetical protein
LPALVGHDYDLEKGGAKNVGHAKGLAKIGKWIRKKGESSFSTEIGRLRDLAEGCGASQTDKDGITRAVRVIIGFVYRPVVTVTPEGGLEQLTLLRVPEDETIEAFLAEKGFNELASLFKKVREAPAAGTSIAAKETFVERCRCAANGCNIAFDTALLDFSEAKVDQLVAASLDDGTELQSMGTTGAEKQPILTTKVLFDFFNSTSKADSYKHFDEGNRRAHDSATLMLQTMSLAFFKKKVNGKASSVLLATFPSAVPSNTFFNAVVLSPSTRPSSTGSWSSGTKFPLSPVVCSLQYRSSAPPSDLTGHWALVTARPPLFPCLLGITSRFRSSWTTSARNSFWSTAVRAFLQFVRFVVDGFSADASFGTRHKNVEACLLLHQSAAHPFPFFPERARTGAPLKVCTPPS